MKLCTALSISSLFIIQSVLCLDADCNGDVCTPLTVAEKQALLDIHNELRDRVAGGGLANDGHPRAKNMNSLMWDDGLAQVAQNYAESCPPWGHNVDAGNQIVLQREANPQNTKWGTKGGPTYEKGGGPFIWTGENLASQSGASYTLDSILSQIETGWFNEYEILTIDQRDDGLAYSGTCSPNADHSSCGHYTAMVWADTRYVGCGYSNGCNPQGGTYSSIFVCNYFPAANFVNFPIYEVATSDLEACSNCLSDRTECKSPYETRSEFSSNFNNGDPFNKLCDGGACSTACNGQSYNWYSCNQCVDPAVLDCTDGTDGLQGGRNICAPVPSPTSSPSKQPSSSPSKQPSSSPSKNPSLAPTSNPTLSPTPIPIAVNDRVSGQVNAFTSLRFELDLAFDYEILNISGCDFSSRENTFNSSMILLFEGSPVMNSTDCGNPSFKQPRFVLSDVKQGDYEILWLGLPGNPNIPRNDLAWFLSVTGTTAPPTAETSNPSKQPSSSPSKQPSSSPSKNPSQAPTSNPTLSRDPTSDPTKSPTKAPTSNPSKQPTSSPSKQPSSSPSDNPSQAPTSKPTTPAPTSPTTTTTTLAPSTQADSDNSGSGSGSDSSDDAVFGAHAVNGDGLKDLIADDAEDEEAYDVVISLGQKTLINVWVILILIIVMNLFFCSLCRRKTEPQRVDSNSDMFGSDV